MLNRSLSLGLTATFTLAGPLLAACSKSNETPHVEATHNDATRSLAAALNNVEGLATLNRAVSASGLRAVFDGAASYTLLAPDDGAFAALGERGAALLASDQRPLLVAALRDHILPGHLTPQNIAAAIDARGGPVTMTTLGGGNVRFARDGDRLTVTPDNGGTANVGGTAIAATNGVIIPIDAVLIAPQERSDQ